MSHPSSLDGTYAGRSVVVTGGAGFIGSNLVIRLVEAGARVAVLDCFEPKTGANPFNLAPVADRIDLHRVDLREDAPRELLKDADIVFNMAAQVSHIDGNEDPKRDLSINALATLNVLETLRHVNPRCRIVFTGSRAQYGRIKRNPVDESHPLDPTDANGVAKTAGEMYHLLYARTYGMRVSSLRLTNTYGPRHLMAHNRQGVLGWFVRQALDGETIRLFGDGSQRRDILHVDDTVDALLLDGLTEATVGQAHNIGGSVHTLREYVETLLGVVGRGRLELAPYPPEWRSVEIGDYVADASRFRKITGWAPRTPLHEGLRGTVDYYRAHGAHYWSMQA